MSIELTPWLYCCCFTICNWSRVDGLPAAEEHLADDERLAVEEAGGGVLAEVDAAPPGEPRHGLQVEVGPAALQFNRINIWL